MPEVGEECDDGDANAFDGCSIGYRVETCAGSCGVQAPAGCWCDAACASFGDCCPDRQDACL